MVVAFDLDDTLCKEACFARSAYREVAALAAALTGVGEEEAFAAMSDALGRGANPFDALQAVAGAPLPTGELVAAYRRHKPLVELPAASRFALDSLRGMGCRLCLLTDGRSEGQRNKIEALGLREWFADPDILISEETGADKTLPDNFLRVEAAHPGDCYAYVGDNPAKDFFHPNRLGWLTVCLLDGDGTNIHGQTPPGDGYAAAVGIGSLTELPGIIETFMKTI